MPPADVRKARVSTQLRIVNGRPDPVIELPHHLFMIEAKVRSLLHEDQLVPYAHHLQQMCSGPSALRAHLIVLAPAASIRTALNLGEAQLAAQGLSSIPLKGITWEQTASTFARCAEQLTAEDYRLRAHIEDFGDLIEIAVGLTSAPLSAEDVACLQDPSVSKLLLTCCHLVDAVIAAMQAQQPSLALTPRSAAREDYIGYDILEKRAWFGIWFRAWAEFGLSPLWLDVRDRQLRLRPVVSAAGRLVRHAGYESFVLPIPLRPLVQPEDLATTIARHILQVLT